MSTALAVAGVTEVMRSMLESWLVSQNVSTALGGTSPEVTATAPDAIALTGTGVKPRLNLYLHQVSVNPGWRNADQPSRDSRGTRTASPPLALDLHYLLTAYGHRDLHAEVLLGYGMQLLHEVPVLDRSEIDNRLTPTLTPSRLGRQLEQIRITPASMSVEDLSKLWSAMQARYRPTASYNVSVVLIEAPTQGRTVLPVLTRNFDVRASMAPTLPGITAVHPQHDRPGAMLGDVVDVEGHALDGTARAVLLENPAFGVGGPPIPVLASSGDSVVRFTVPPNPLTLPVGIYSLTVLVTKPGDTQPRETNRLSLAILPNVTTAWPINANRDGAGTARIALNCVPQVQPHQRVSLIVGGREVPADPHLATTGAITFTMTNAVPGSYYTRLRIDGLESLIVERDASPLAYLNRQVVIT